MGSDDRVLLTCRRAGLLMILLGVVGLLMGACFAGTGVVFPRLQLPAETAHQIAELEAQLNVSADVLFIVTGVMALIPSLLLFILGFFVRKGSKASTITGLIVTALVVLVLSLQVLGGLLGGPSALLGVVLLAIPLSLYILLLVWLSKALKSAVHGGAAEKMKVD